MHFTSLLSEAERGKSQGQDPLPILESAQQLVHGEFLEDEWYSEWAQGKRDTMNAARHHLFTYACRSLHATRDG